MAQLLFSLPLVPLETDPCLILSSVSEPLLVSFIDCNERKILAKIGWSLVLSLYRSVTCLPTFCLPIPYHCTANLLFTVFCKDAMNLELMHSEYLLLEEIQGRIPKNFWSHFGKPMCITSFYVFLFVYKHFI